MALPTLTDRFRAAVRAALRAWESQDAHSFGNSTAAPPYALPEMYTGWLSDERAVLVLVMPRGPLLDPHFGQRAPFGHR